MNTSRITSLLSEKEAGRIKELMENVHNNKKLSEIESDYLDMRGLKIINDGHDVHLMKDDKSLVSIQYYTVGSPSSEAWAKFDKSFSDITDKGKPLQKLGSPERRIGL